VGITDICDVTTVSGAIDTVAANAGSWLTDVSDTLVLAASEMTAKLFVTDYFTASHS